LEGNLTGPVTQDQFKIIWIAGNDSVDQVYVLISKDQTKNIAKIAIVIRIESHMELQIKIALQVEGAIRSQVQTGSLIQNKFMRRKLHSIELG